MNNNLKELIDYYKQQDPVMWEQAEKEVKEWNDKVKSGEIQLDIKELYFDENRDLREA